MKGILDHLPWCCYCDNQPPSLEYRASYWSCEHAGSLDTKWSNKQACPWDITSIGDYIAQCKGHNLITACTIEKYCNVPERGSYISPISCLCSFLRYNERNRVVDLI